MSDANIEVEHNGPYHVTGVPSLVRVSKVTTERGENVDWHVDEELTADDEMVERDSVVGVW